MKILAVAIAAFAVGVCSALAFGKVYLEQVRSQQEQRIVCKLGPYGSDPVDQRCPRY